VWYIDDADFDTGQVTADWNYIGELDISGVPDYALFQTQSPRVRWDTDKWYMYLSGQSTKGAYQIPNWIFYATSANLTNGGTWACQNTDSKYRQSLATGTNIARCNGGVVNFYDSEIIAEVAMGLTGIEEVLIFFRYNDLKQIGYAAGFDYNGGDSYIRLYKFTLGYVFTELDSLAISTFPDFYYGYPWRIRIRAYGENIDVAYSAWGNPWIEALSVVDYTYSYGRLGAATINSAALFNNIRIREYVDAEPIVGEGSETSFKRIFITQT